MNVVLEHVAHANPLTSDVLVSDWPGQACSANMVKHDSVQTMTRTKAEFKIPSPGIHLAISACAAATMATSLDIHFTLLLVCCLNFN